jgi:hypothetical protein
MSPHLRSAIGCWCILFLCGQLQGANYSVTPSFNSALETVAPYNPIPGYQLDSGVPALLQFDFYVHYSDPAPTHFGFGNLVFTIGLEGLTSPFIPPWQPATVCNPSTGGQCFVASVNAGGSNDLRYIIAENQRLLGVPMDDYRWTIFEQSEVLVGSVLLDYQGGPAKLTVAPDTSAGGVAASYLDANGLFQVDRGNPNLYGGEILIGVAPEPSGILLSVSLLLVALGSRGRRRQP